MAQVTRQPSPAGSFVPTDTRSGQPWWLQPLLVVTVLTLFGLYALWTSLQGNGFSDPYLSPFYSPRVPFGGIFAPFFVLWVPLGFRASCYYYRKAYYRSFFWDPPACARPDPHRGPYRGERGFPFILNNFHRFFLYLSIIVVLVLWYDAIRAFWFGGRFGVGAGSLVLLANIILLTLYTFSCHSLRHIVGGHVDCFSCAAFGRPRHSAWRGASILNERHGLYAWLSLWSVGLADLYVRLVASGAIRDLRLW
jgi:hypothetical protein